MTARYLIGDVREQLATLEDNSVDLVLSSPPFLALRSYLPADHPDKASEIGSEPTPGEFLDTILDVVEACARVLAPHGSLVFEFGDTYSGNGGTPGDAGKTYHNRNNDIFDGGQYVIRTRGDRNPGGDGWPLDKSLTLIPESFAWALAYGRNPWTGRETDPWRIRNFCPWVRPNPPVGALGDKFRPATSYLTVATKARDRWFDLDAVRTPHKYPEMVNVPKRPAKYVDEAVAQAHDHPHRGNGAGAPPLDWFLIPTQPYPGQHYATWPQRLALPFIESMCPRQVCCECGEPRRRIVDQKPYATDYEPTGRSRGPRDTRGGVHRSDRPSREVETLGWSDCGHDSWRNGVVLDPFAGSGTTLQVATGCGRDAIGIDIDERNALLAAERVGMFLTIESESAA